MRILKIWDAEYPWDVRAEKVSYALTSAGHQVHLLARNRDRRPCFERRPEADVHRLRPWWRLPPKLDAATQFPAFLSPRWIAHVSRIARATAPDLILVRDLPLAPTAIFVGRMRRRPVVLDMAENYPAMIAAIWAHGRHKPYDRLIRNPKAVAAIEHWVLSRIDHVVVVVEESQERLADLGFPRERTTVALNTPTAERIPDEVPLRPPFQDDRALRLVYLGLMEAPRGIDVVLRAVAESLRRAVAVHLDLIGPGREFDLFKARAYSLGLTEKTVVFHGHLPYEKALGIVAAADVGLVPHLANESWNTTIPNKLFDYMSLGLPVITSDARPAARIVLETGSGTVYRSTSPKELADRIEEMTEPNRHQAAARCGRAAVLSRYNWSVDGSRLVRALESVWSRRQARRTD